MLLSAVPLWPRSSITVTLTPKRPAAVATTLAVSASAPLLKPSTMPPASEMTQCTEAMVRPIATALVAALSSIACPASGASGVTAMRATTTFCAACTAAPASSMPAPQVPVVQ